MNGKMGVLMERDIIIKALYRFQDLVAKAPSQTISPNQDGESDRRLARLAIKKYNKTVAWRSRISLSREDQKELSP
jgi:hypothetical protein